MKENFMPWVNVHAELQLCCTSEKIREAMKMEMEKTNKKLVKQKIMNAKIPVKKMPPPHKDYVHTIT
jgi:hypothetical protein